MTVPAAAGMASVVVGRFAWCLITTLILNPVKLFSFAHSASNFDIGDSYRDFDASTIGGRFVAVRLGTLFCHK